MRLGFDNVGVFDNKKSRSIWEVRNGTVEFKGGARFGNGFKISVNDNGRLVFGDGFMLTAESTIICYKEIVFGNDCMLSWEILVMDTDFHDITSLSGTVLNSPRRISIGDKVWIGCHTLILKGSEVRSGSVIGAGSVVTGILDHGNSVYAGSPPKLLKADIRWNP